MYKISSDPYPIYMINDVVKTGKVEEIIVQDYISMNYDGSMDSSAQLSQELRRVLSKKFPIGKIFGFEEYKNCRKEKLFEGIKDKKDAYKRAKQKLERKVKKLESDLKQVSNFLENFTN